MDNDHPVTRRELDEVLTDFKAELKAELKVDWAESQAEFRDEVMAGMRQIETSLLTAFHSYSTAQYALHTMDVVDNELRIRMDQLESRVLALEARRPPAA